MIRSPSSARPVRLAARILFTVAFSTLLSARENALGQAVTIDDDPVAPPAASATAPPTLFIAGDSTAADGAPGAIGWGKYLGTFFDPSKLKVVNRARGGRSSRTFIAEGLWDRLLDDVKAGDFVLIQFGHNDAGPINDERRAAARSPGSATSRRKSTTCSPSSMRSCTPSAGTSARWSPTRRQRGRPPSCSR